MHALLDDQTPDAKFLLELDFSIGSSAAFEPAPKTSITAMLLQKAIAQIKYEPTSEPDCLLHYYGYRGSSRSFEGQSLSMQPQI